MDLKNVPNLGRTVNGRPLVIDESKNEGIQGTVLCSNLLTPPIQELYNAIVMSGLTPSSDNTQLYQLLKRSQDSINTLQAEEAQLQNNINQLQNYINNELTQSFADLSKAIHDGNEELATTLSGLIGHIITVEGASSTQINNEIAARQQADSAIYQTIQSLTNQVVQEVNNRQSADDNIAKLIHDGNEEIAATISQLKGSVSTSAGATSDALNQEIADRKAGEASLAQAIHDGNEEVASSLRNLVNQAITISGGTSTSLTQEISDRKAADDNLAKAIQDGNEEITSTINSMVGKALAVSGEQGSYIPPIGALIGWQGSTPPSGWILCNGESFSTTQYPSLASVYPSGTLPNLSSGAMNYIVKAT